MSPSLAFPSLTPSQGTPCLSQLAPASAPRSISNASQLPSLCASISNSLPQTDGSHCSPPPSPTIKPQLQRMLLKALWELTLCNTISHETPRSPRAPRLLPTHHCPLLTPLLSQAPSLPESHPAPLLQALCSSSQLRQAPQLPSAHPTYDFVFSGLAAHGPRKAQS